MATETLKGNVFKQIKRRTNQTLCEGEREGMFVSNSEKKQKTTNDNTLATSKKKQQVGEEENTPGRRSFNDFLSSVVL